MKRIILPALASLIILVMTNTVYADTATKAVVNTEAVRIRESESTESGIVTNIYEDDEVEVLGENGEWYKVKYKDSVGYAKKEFFKITKQGDNLSTSTNTTENVTNTVSQTPDTTQTATTNQVSNETTTQAQTPVSNNIQNVMVGDIIVLPVTMKLRAIPSFGASEKIEIAQGAGVEIQTKVGNWYKISDNVSTGWITNNKLVANQSSVPETPQAQPEPEKTEPETTEPETTEPEKQPEQTQEEKKEPETTTSKSGIVIVETARVRKAASASSELLTTLDEDQIVTILGEEGDFYKISTSSITEGYISKSLIREKDVTSRSGTGREDTVDQEANDALTETLTEATSSTVTGEDIIAFAKQFLGYSYVSGGSSPETGFDCSGFTKYVFGHFGFTLARVAADQTSVGAVVERENLQTGDLILFYDDAKSRIGHCAIYIGGGDFIHSANPKRGVVIDNINTNSYYSQRFVTARRIIQ